MQVNASRFLLTVSLDWPPGRSHSPKLGCYIIHIEGVATTTRVHELKNFALTMRLTAGTFRKPRSLVRILCFRGHNCHPPPSCRHPPLQGHGACMDMTRKQCRYLQAHSFNRSKSQNVFIEITKVSSSSTATAHQNVSVANLPAQTGHLHRSCHCYLHGVWARCV